HSGMSMLTVSIFLGAIIGNLVPRLTHQGTHAGIMLAQQNLLRWGVALYGLNLSLQQILQVGPAALVIDVLMVTCTLTLGWYVGVKLLHMDPQTVLLTSAGSAICGAAAVVATEPVLEAPAHKTAAAVGTVVLFGSLAMIVYPLLATLYPISSSLFGTYAGSTVHEVAQVVAIGKTIGGNTADTAVIVKMIRVMLLAPFLLVAGHMFRKSSGTIAAAKAGVPRFAVMFIIIALVHPYLHLPEVLVTTLRHLDVYMLAMAMAALGLNTTMAKLRLAGKDALILGSLLFVWLIVGGGLVNLLVQHAFHTGWL
ncbi:MAG: YeiH family putative sulfate export transporter, partial [Pseudomonadales bacterium]|nr:YeiH family putative sulfate export transporter [Pseudomonadales bacterium]